MAVKTGESSTRLLTSTSQLLARATDWDRLWQESDSTLPSARAEIIALWTEGFAGNRPFRALIAQREEKLVGALPLIGCKILPAIEIGMLPRNVWAASGDMLVSQDCDSNAVIRLLARGLRHLPWNIIVLERVPYELPRWKMLRECLRDEGSWCSVVHQYRAPLVDIGGDWASYEASLKGRHRQRRRRNGRMLRKRGRVEFRIHSTLTPDEVEPLMRRGFEVEDRSWKGDAGTSILKNQDALDYYITEARKLAEWRQLEIAFLELDGEPITFCYGWNAKGTRYSVKTGYDRKFSKFGPGQQQCMHMLQHAHQDPACSLYDFYGRVMPWNEMWATRVCDVGRLIICRKPGPARAVAALYTRLHPAAKRARTHLQKMASEFKRK